MAFCFTRERTQVMGILNLTPDSFSDGGDYFLPEDALRRALELQAQGADILDLGAQSTRPGHSPLPSAEELNRLLPLLELLRGRLHIPISIDTFYPEVAQAALERGAAIINDVSGVVDVNMARVILRYNAGWVLMHNGGGADETQNYLPDVVCAVRTALEEMADAALRLGLKKEQICLDPGIGFGKSQADNLLLLKYTAQFSSLGFCVLVGASRKRVIAFAAGGACAPKERLAGTIAAHTVAQLGGADILRVHDVAPALQAARMADAIRAAGISI